ncbi:fibronectin type III domain-containing protein 7-like [Antennarius striatus]|uniref:fibronectin type III domain-containing protein 7-like n=1 Tax=Antennarius striatus TaxID=241820 RepID=UPI0035B45DB1
MSETIQVSVFSATSKTMILRWTRVVGATSYRISVARLDSPSDPIAFANFGENTVMGSINSLSPNIMYTFTLDALDVAQATLISASLDSTTAPQVMGSIHTVKSKDSRNLIVEFDPSVGATHYIIRVRNAYGFYREDTVWSSPAEITDLEPYTDYTLSVIAVNGELRSQPSPPVNAKTILPPPQFDNTSSPTNDSITVSLYPIAQAVSYNLSLYKLSSGTSLVYTTSDTIFTISGLEAGSLYMIDAVAMDVEGREGERSSYVNQTTRPPTPTSVSASVVSGNLSGLSVSWELDPDVDGYIHYRVMTDQYLYCNSTSNSCVLWGISCGEIYTIYVIAVNDAGPTYPSSPLVFVTYPCPPGSLAYQASSEGNCSLTWDAVPHADGYKAYIKRGDGGEDTCNTTSNNCTYHCECGFTYLLSVFAFNEAGKSPQGNVLNYTAVPCCPENVAVAAVSTDTLEITWMPSRGAVDYKIEAQDWQSYIHFVQCKDTAPVCALSDLHCDTPYHVHVSPCNEVSGCNYQCEYQIQDTAPCMPADLMLHSNNSTSIGVSWTANNRDANYMVSAVGYDGVHTCTTSGSYCDITDLPCGSEYEVSVMAVSAAGQSLPSFSDSLETAPCCPEHLTVDQVTQAMTNVSWSYAKGAHSVITSLTSMHGHARCHTKDSHCLMGCITCGTNYTVTMEAYSHSGQMSNCTYNRFSSSACCPSGVKIYKAGNSLRVYWHNAGGNYSYVTEMVASSNNYTCTASLGENSCDVAGVQCGEVYSVVVAPLTLEGAKVLFCPHRLYSVTCLGSNVGTVIYRGKRSVD